MKCLVFRQDPLNMMTRAPMIPRMMPVRNKTHQMTLTVQTMKTTTLMMTTMMMTTMMTALMVMMKVVAIVSVTTIAYYLRKFCNYSE